MFGRFRMKKWMWWALGALVALQIYFVRELLAAELLFGLLFGVAFVVFTGVWLVGHVGERSVAWAEVHARQAFELAEGLSKKTFRRPHSESAR